MNDFLRQFISLPNRLLSELEQIKNELIAAHRTYKTKNAERDGKPIVFTATLSRSQADIQQDNRRHEEHQGHQNRNLLVQIMGLLVTMIIAVATLLSAKAAKDAAKASRDQASAAWKNIEITSKSIDLTVDNFHRDQRAWVGPYHPRIDHSSFGTIIVIGDTMNFGKTPATLTRIRLGSQFLNGYNTEPPTDPFKNAGWKSDSNDTFVEFPSQPGIQLGLSAPAYTGETLNEIRNMTKTLNFFGEINYRDTFGSDHFTRFCLHYVLTWGPDSKEALVACKNWNATDDTPAH
jgi:hypothetical protein